MSRDELIRQIARTFQSKVGIWAKMMRCSQTKSLRILAETARARGFKEQVEAYEAAASGQLEEFFRRRIRREEKQRKRPASQSRLLAWHGELENLPRTLRKQMEKSLEQIPALKGGNPRKLTGPEIALAKTRFKELREESKPPSKDETYIAIAKVINRRRANKVTPRTIRREIERDDRAKPKMDMLGFQVQSRMEQT